MPRGAIKHLMLALLATGVLGLLLFSMRKESSAQQLSDVDFANIGMRTWKEKDAFKVSAMQQQVRHGSVLAGTAVTCMPVLHPAVHLPIAPCMPLCQLTKRDQELNALQAAMRQQLTTRERIMGNIHAQEALITMLQQRVEAEKAEKQRAVYSLGMMAQQVDGCQHSAQKATEALSECQQGRSH